MPRYYPKLSRLINEDVIPDELGFLKPAIKNVFSGLHYRNLHIENTSREG